MTDNLGNPPSNEAELVELMRSIDVARARELHARIEAMAAEHRSATRRCAARSAGCACAWARWPPRAPRRAPRSRWRSAAGLGSG